jgi:prevent-host-death family protein
MKTVSAAEFKNSCLALLAEVERTRIPVVVTRHGKPFARIAPVTVSSEVDANPLRDSIEFESDIVSPTGAEWQALG